MEQLILHLVGDYVTQSQWMADNKTQRFWPAYWHAMIYSPPFLLIGSPVACGVICATHFLIDRYRLARFVVWLKNGGGWWYLMRLDPQFQDVLDHANGEDPLELAKTFCASAEKWKWENCSATGYPSQTPAWLAVWLLIAADNTLHLAINYRALRWL